MNNIVKQILCVVLTLALLLPACALAECTHPFKYGKMQVDIEGYYDCGDGMEHQICVMITEYCTNCGYIFNQYGDGGETEPHTYDSKGVCTKCKYNSRANSAQGNQNGANGSQDLIPAIPYVPAYPTEHNTQFTYDTIPEGDTAPVAGLWESYEEGLKYLTDNQLTKLTDNSRISNFEYTIWRSLRQNGIADVTLYYHRPSAQGLLIRGGDQSFSTNFEENARPKNVVVKVYTTEDVYEFETTLKDEFNAPNNGYVSFGTMLEEIERIEFYFLDFYAGSKETYNMVISDIVLR